jgi:hypothetical protein
MKDKINPSHYKDNPIQTFDAITSQFTDAEKIGAIKFNICKEPDELTEEDIEELLNPGIIRFRNKKEDKNDKDTK